MGRFAGSLWVAAAVGVASLFGTPLASSAQEIPVPSPVEARSPTRVADALVADSRRLHDAFEPDSALAQLRRALRADPLHYEALWLTAAESVAVGVLSDDPDASAELFAAAVDFARRATEVLPSGVEGHEWLAVALGRHALSVGVRERVRFAEEILATATHATNLSTESAVGHHVVGQWHAEIRRLGGLERFIARRFLGGETFGTASLETALQHLTQAVELNPVEAVHQFELARVYVDMERPNEARVRFQAIIDAPLISPTDVVYKRRAREYLVRIGTSRQ